MAMLGVLVTEVVTSGSVFDIASPIAGQVIFYGGSENTQGYYLWNGTAWILLSIRPE